MKKSQNKRDTKKFRKSLKNKQRNNPKTIGLPKRNTDTIYSVVITGMYQMNGVGFNLPESELGIEDELSKGNIYESVVLLDLENGRIQSPSILSIVHNGFPNGDTVQDLIMRSLSLIMRNTNLPFLTSDTKITISMVTSNGIGTNIYSDYDNYLEYVKSTHEGLMTTLLGSLKNVG
jgi:hypothetical protein